MSIDRKSMLKHNFMWLIEFDMDVKCDYVIVAQCLKVTYTFNLLLIYYVGIPKSYTGMISNVNDLIYSLNKSHFFSTNYNNLNE